MYMNTFRQLLLPALCIAASTQSQAHHALVGYDRQSVVQQTGVIEELFWRNPHIRIKLRADDGSVWDLEGPPVNRMERNDGVTKELFAPGTRMTLVGMPSLRSETSLFPLVAVMESGERIVMERPDAERLGILKPEENRRVVKDERYYEAVEKADGVFRVWTNVGRTFHYGDPRVQGSDEARWPLTDLGRSVKAEWDQLEEGDDLAEQCIQAGMPEAMMTPFPMELIDNGDGTLTLLLEEWDNVRTIYMTDERPDELAEPHLGYSVGRWEDDVLVVTTTDVSYPYMNDAGTPLSDNAQIIGRFVMSEDETKLDWIAEVIDPLYLSEPLKLPTMHFAWQPEVFIRKFECTMYTPADERVEGGPNR